MHWIIQENIYNEKGLNDLLSFLNSQNIPYTEVKIVPFIGKIEPNIKPEGKVICIGSYSMRNIAKENNWLPGVYDLDKYDYKYLAHPDRWGKLMLNFDAKYEKFGVMKPFDDFSEFFIRPIKDSKVIAGRIEDDKEKFLKWQNRVIELGEDSYGLNVDTDMMYCSTKKIYKEYRYWIVDRKISTRCIYKEGRRVIYKPSSDIDVDLFVNNILNMYALDSNIPFVLDIAETNLGYRIIEINTLNASGLYDADVQKLVFDLSEFEKEWK